MPAPVMCVIFLFILLTPHARAGDAIRFHHLSPQDGLSSSNNLCILQDRFGFMWLGTWGGFNRFDGYEIVSYRYDSENPNSLSNMDLVMPVMNGFEATQEIRQTAGDIVPIIAVSASVLSYEQQQIQARGFEAFLLKPVNLDDVLTTLQQHVRLEWEYDEASAEPTTPLSQGQSKTDIIAPPQEVLESLYELAMKGLMERVTERAAQIENMGSGYRPFALRVKRFAANFEDEELLDFLKQYLD